MRRAALLLVLLVGACGGGGDEGPKPVLLASFFPLAEVSRAVGGSDADVIDLTPSGEDPHGLTELTTADVTGVDVLVHLGRGFQPAVDQLVAAFDGVVVDGLRGLPIVEDDVHVWLDPTMLSRIATSVRDALSEANPDRADTYADNAASYQQTLVALDRRLTAGLASCDRNVVVTAHAAWRYFTSRYRIEQEPLAGVSPAEPPAPGRAEDLGLLVRDAGVTTVFREPLVHDAPITALADATGAQVATLDSLEGDGGAYVQRMGRNLAALRTALGCS